MRAPGRGAVALRAARARLGRRLREPLERDRRLRRATCATRSTGRSARTSIETVRGVGYRLRDGRREPAADPLAGDAGLRGHACSSCSARSARSSTCASTHDLSETLDRGLRARAGEVEALVRRSPGGLARGEAPALEADESVAQVLRRRRDGGGRNRRARGRRLLSADRLRRARRGRRPGRPRRRRRARRGTSGCSRCRSGRAARSWWRSSGPRSDEKDEAVSTLLTLELVGLGAALLLASAAGYFVSGAALRPVEAMRRRAEEITDTPGRASRAAEWTTRSAASA